MAIISDWLTNLYVGFRRLVGWSINREIWLYKHKSNVWKEPTLEDMRVALSLLNISMFDGHMDDPKAWTLVGVQCKHGEHWNELPKVPDPFPIPNDLLRVLEEDSVLQETSFYQDDGIGIPTRCTVRLFNSKEEADSYWKAYLEHMFKNNRNGEFNGSNYTGLSG